MSDIQKSLFSNDPDMRPTFSSVEPSPKAQRHSATSVAAARSIESETKTQRAIALGFFRQADEKGLTDEELIDLMGKSPSTCRPRRVELVEMDLVKDSGMCRPGRSGRDMTVWIYVKKGA